MPANRMNFWYWFGRMLILNLNYTNWHFFCWTFTYIIPMHFLYQQT